VIIQNEKTKMVKNLLKNCFTFVHKNKHIQVISVNLSNAEFSWREDTLDYVLDQWTYDIEILYDGISYNIYDLTYSNRDGMPIVVDDDIKEIIIEEIKNADDLFTFYDKKEVTI
tara:strand:- start:931 stop:1272 length:342 start_codon:yes stop_codon:yes gene_type:complete